MRIMAVTSMMMVVMMRVAMFALLMIQIEQGGDTDGNGRHDNGGAGPMTMAVPVAVVAVVF